MRGSKKLGVSKSTGLTCYWSLSQVKLLTFYARQGGATEATPEAMLHQLSEARGLEHGRADRRLVLIVEGSLEYLSLWNSAALPVDLYIFIGNIDALDRLGVEIIDRAWAQTDKPINLNRIVQDLLVI